MFFLKNQPKNKIKFMIRIKGYVSPVNAIQVFLAGSDKNAR